MLRFTLRLPEEIHARLVKAAAEDGRSIHGEILWLLVKALNSRQELNSAQQKNGGRLVESYGTSPLDI